MDSIVTAIERVAGYSGIYMQLVLVIGIVAGLWFMISGLLIMRNMGSGRQGDEGLSGVMSRLIVGICLFSFSTFLVMGSVTLFGGSTNMTSNAEMIFAYAPETAGQFSDPEFRASIVAAVIVFQMIGVYGIFKGITMVVAYNKGTQREMGPIWTHIGFGLIALNFPAFFAWVEAIVV